MDIPLHDPSVESKKARQKDAKRFRLGATVAGVFVALLWWIKILESIMNESLMGLGVYPQTIKGLIGIITAPLIHGSWEHLLANSLALLLLGWLSFAVYPKASWRATLLVWLGSGIGIWLFGRPSFHIGASGLSHGFLFFVFLLGVLKRDRRAVATAMIAFFMYGGMVLTILPREYGISWEAHLSGAVFGLLAALLWRNLDPSLPKRTYEWEEDEEEAIWDESSSSDALIDAWQQQQRATYETSTKDVVPLWEGPRPDHLQALQSNPPRKQIIILSEWQKAPEDKPDS